MKWRTLPNFVSRLVTSIAITIIILGFAEHGNRTISNAERKFALNFLQDTKSDLVKSVKKLTDEQLKFKSTPESWSIAECIEHLALTESLLYANLMKMGAQQSDSSRRKELKYSDKQLIEKVIDRSTKFKTAEILAPTGKFESSQAALSSFLAKRDETVQYVKSSQTDFRNHFGKHQAFGVLDSYQWVLIFSAHCKRHTLQIKEIKTNSSFPHH